MIDKIVNIALILIVVLIWVYTVWNGISFQIHSGKFNFEVEIYSLKRFFSKK